MIICKEVDYANFGKCLAISNEKIEIYVTIDVGPRIIKFNFLGKENLMFTDINREISEDVQEVFGKDKRWYIYGGHRMWVSPENLPLTYYPDNEKVSYSIHQKGATFTPPPQKINNLQHQIDISISDDTVVKVTHSLTNLNQKPINGAIWALSVMAPNGEVVVPQPNEDTKLLGNRVLALWPYTNMSDKRVLWGNEYIAVQQCTCNSNKFKFGINNTQGWLAYINDDETAFFKSYSSNHPDGTYPDFGVSTEVFTNGKFIEFETLSEYKNIEPNKTITHTETWLLIEDIPKPFFDSDSIKSVADLIIAKKGLKL